MAEIPLPEVGTSAKFAFSEPFNELDGVYRLASIRPYDVAISDGVDLLDGLYAIIYDGEGENPETELTNDLPNLVDQPILQLVERNATTPKTYNMPYAHLASVPDPQLVQAHALKLVIDLGLFKDPTEFSYLVGHLNDVAAATTGTENTAKMFSSGTTWMTLSEYSALETARAADISGLTLQAKTITAQATTISKLNTQIEALNAIITSLTS
jgi:hypothetical protein